MGNALGHTIALACGGQHLGSHLPVVGTGRLLAPDDDEESRAGTNSRETAGDDDVGPQNAFWGPQCDLGAPCWKPFIKINVLAPFSEVR